MERAGEAGQTLVFHLVLGPSSRLCPASTLASPMPWEARRPQHGCQEPEPRGLAPSFSLRPDSTSAHKESGSCQLGDLPCDGFRARCSFQGSGSGPQLGRHSRKAGDGELCPAVSSCPPMCFAAWGPACCSQAFRVLSCRLLNRAREGGVRTRENVFE